MAVGRPIGSTAEAQSIMRALGDGDATALQQLGVDIPEGFDTASIEWGLGQRADGSYVIIRGQGDAVDWSGFPDVVPVAHSHPYRPDRALQGVDQDGGMQFGDLLTSRGSSDRVLVFPSAQDVRFMAAHGLDTHTVNTPYVYLGDGRIGNPTPGNNAPSVDFVIRSPETAGTFLGNPDLPVHRSVMEVRAGDQVIWTGEVYSVAHPALGSMVDIELPPGMMHPLGDSSGGDQTAAGTPRPEDSQTQAGGGDRVVRQDNDFEATVNHKGVPKSHIDADGSLRPANPDGDTTPLEHIYGMSPAKDNSPYTSFMTESGGVAKSYGAAEVEVDIERLRADIESGALEGVVIVTPEQLQASIRADIASIAAIDVDTAIADGPAGITRFVEASGLSKKQKGRLERRLLALYNTSRDGEWLIGGVIPAAYLSGPNPVAGAS